MCGERARIEGPPMCADGGRCTVMLKGTVLVLGVGGRCAAVRGLCGYNGHWNSIGSRHRGTTGTTGIDGHVVIQLPLKQDS